MNEPPHDDPFDASYLKRYLAEVTINSNYAYWGALLTMNAIIVAVFSIAIFFAPAQAKGFVLAPTILSMISSALIIRNFQHSRDHFKELGTLALQDECDIPGEKKRKMRERAPEFQDALIVRERIVTLILFVQTLGIGVLLYVGINT